MLAAKPSHPNCKKVGESNASVLTLFSLPGGLLVYIYISEVGGVRAPAHPNREIVFVFVFARACVRAGGRSVNGCEVQISGKFHEHSQNTGHKYMDIHRD